MTNPYKNQNQGAEDDLRDLLCYYGFGINWYDTLNKFGFKEAELMKQIEDRKATDNKSNKKQRKDTNYSSINTTPIVDSKIIEETEVKAPNEIKDSIIQLSDIETFDTSKGNYNILILPFRNPYKNN